MFRPSLLLPWVIIEAQALRLALNSMTDQTILGTAVPQITNDFHSLQDVGWYASAYVSLSPSRSCHIEYKLKKYLQYP